MENVKLTQAQLSTLLHHANAILGTEWWKKELEDYWEFHHSDSKFWLRPVKWDDDLNGVFLGETESEALEVLKSL
jgi:hypothetical protein